MHPLLLLCAQLLLPIFAVPLSSTTDRVEYQRNDDAAFLFGRCSDSVEWCLNGGLCEQRTEDAEPTFVCSCPTAVIGDRCEYDLRGYFIPDESPVLIDAATPTAAKPQPNPEFIYGRCTDDPNMCMNEGICKQATESFYFCHSCPANVFGARCEIDLRGLIDVLPTAATTTSSLPHVPSTSTEAVCLHGNRISTSSQCICDQGWKGSICDEIDEKSEEADDDKDSSSDSLSKDPSRSSDAYLVPALLFAVCLLFVLVIVIFYGITRREARKRTRIEYAEIWTPPTLAHLGDAYPAMKRAKRSRVEKKEENTAFLEEFIDVQHAFHNDWIPAHPYESFESEDTVLFNIQLLIQNNADINIRDKNGYTLLHLAIMHSHLNVIQYLIDLPQVDAVAETAKERTPLHLAVEKNDFAMVSYLLRRHEVRSKVNACDVFNWTPLVLHVIRNAAIMGELPARTINPAQIIRELVTAGADPSYPGDNTTRETDHADRTALHYAVEHRDLEMAAALIEAGANVNATDANRRTPLHAAIQRRDVSLAKLLVNAGAKSSIQNHNLESPLDLAKLMKLDKIVALLEDEKAVGEPLRNGRKKQGKRRLERPLTSPKSRRRSGDTGYGSEREPRLEEDEEAEGEGEGVTETQPPVPSRRESLMGFGRRDGVEERAMREFNPKESEDGSPLFSVEIIHDNHPHFLQKAPVDHFSMGPPPALSLPPTPLVAASTPNGTPRRPPSAFRPSHLRLNFQDSPTYQEIPPSTMRAYPPIPNTQQPFHADMQQPFAFAPVAHYPFHPQCPTGYWQQYYQQPPSFYDPTQYSNVQASPYYPPYPQFPNNSDGYN